MLDKQLWQRQLRGIYSFRGPSISTAPKRPKLPRRHTAQVNPEAAKGHDGNEDDDDDYNDLLEVDIEEDEDREDEDEEEEGGDDDDDDDDDEQNEILQQLKQSGDVSEEIQGMSRLIMRRMDTLESGFKNLELLLSRLPDVATTMPQATSVTTRSSTIHTDQYRKDGPSSRTGD